MFACWISEEKVSVMLRALCCLLLVSGTLQACPPGFSTSSYLGVDYCIHVGAADMNFCAAADYCALLGSQLLHSNAFQAIQYASGNGNYWLGLTDALNERGSNRAGWIWFGGAQTTSTNHEFAIGEPSDSSGTKDCVYKQALTSVHYSTPCSSQNKPACVIVPLPTYPSNQSGFRRISTFGHTQPGSGCWEKRPAGRKTLCAHLCVKRIRCVGFFYNSIRRECVLLPHFDATVQLDSATANETAAWSKYLIE